MWKRTNQKFNKISQGARAYCSNLPYKLLNKLEVVSVCARDMPIHEYIIRHTWRVNADTWIQQCRENVWGCTWEKYQYEKSYSLVCEYYNTQWLLYGFFFSGVQKKQTLLCLSPSATLTTTTYFTKILECLFVLLFISLLTSTRRMFSKVQNSAKWICVQHESLFNSPVVHSNVGAPSVREISLRIKET